MKGDWIYVSKKKNNRKSCRVCEKEMALSHFYSTTSPFFSDKKIDVCTPCAIKIVEKEGFKGFQDLMKLINKPIYHELYKEDVRDYIRQMNSLPQYRGLTYEDSNLFEEVKSISSSSRDKPKELTEEELKESEEFWGSGREEEDYIWLNTEYQDYLSRYEVDSKTLEDLICEICLTRLDIRDRRNRSLEVDKQIKTLNDLLTSANLKPSQETGNQAVEHETFGTLIKKWENTRPIQDSSEWEEKDKLKTYVKTWFTGHLMRLFDVENKDEREYQEELNKYTISQQDDERDDEK